ncbi:MAG: cupredoxin domain-containing protein [bacterium]
MIEVASSSKRWHRESPKAIALALVAGVVGLTLTTAAPGYSQARATSWTVLGGVGARNNALAALRFLPKEITINVGDSVQWKWGGGDAHTVYFPAEQKSPKQVVPSAAKEDLIFNPAIVFPTGRSVDGSKPVSAGGIFPPDPSGQAPPPPALTFSKEGTYEYLCLFHPGMRGAVIVRSAGSPRPATQAQVDAQARQEAAPALAAAEKLFDSLKVQKEVGPDGKAAHVMPLRASEATMGDVLRFLPSRLSIRMGETVTWRMDNPINIHTVTFIGKTDKMIDVVTVKPQKQGPPVLAVTPEAVRQSPQRTFAGSGMRNSGWLGTASYAEFAGYAPLVKLSTSYSLTFTKTGVYPYHCAVHPFAGMRGAIVVSR